jgi:hypothetical protein
MGQGIVTGSSGQGFPNGKMVNKQLNPVTNKKLSSSPNKRTAFGQPNPV